MQLAHNSQDLYTSNIESDYFWTQFQAKILEHANDLQSLEHYAKSAMPALHQHLYFQNEYQNSMVKIQHEPIESGSLSFPLFENDTIRVNLNAIEPERGLPLHDHPDSAGLTYIIQGQANIIQCDACTNKQAGSPQSSLSVTKNKTFSAGQISCFTKDKHNIHAINAISERCVMLVVHTNTAMTEKQSFYFSSNKEKNIGSLILTQRTSAKTLKNFSKNKL